MALVAAALLAAGVGCSSSTPEATSSTGSTTTSVPGSYERPACTPRAAQEVTATPVAGSDSDYDVTSFDGTRIRAHWFPVENAGSDGAPTVLKGPGWGLAGDVNTEGSGYGLFGDLGINSLNDDGYNVLTWDPRGFGASSGTVETNSPDFEGRDVQQLVDWVAAQPGVQLDADNDPRMGMVGASYGGGIQLTVASIDCRVDAIVPQLAWHSLGTSLYKANTAKTGWGNLLYGVAGEHTLDPHITSAHTESNESGMIAPADVEWFVSRGPGDDVGNITAPTLFEQGTIDTLFTLDEAVTNYRILKEKGVPTAMVWMCSGHGVCLTDPGDQRLPGTAALAWLDRYVKDDSSAAVGPEFRYVDQNGVSHSARGYPIDGQSIVMTAAEPVSLTLTAGGGAGPAVSAGNAGALGGIALPITPGRAEHAANVTFTVDGPNSIVGAPHLDLTYRGTSPPGERPTRVFAQLVDDETGLVIGNQITPIEVTLDGQEHDASVPLEMIAFTARRGSRLTLQLVATTTAYAEPRLGGTVDFASVRVELPTIGS
jgi:ABC-2 type transport system ATP-binding protein